MRWFQGTIRTTWIPSLTTVFWPLKHSTIFNNTRFQITTFPASFCGFVALFADFHVIHGRSRFTNSNKRHLFRIRTRLDAKCWNNLLSHGVLNIVPYLYHGVVNMAGNYTHHTCIEFLDYTSQQWFFNFLVFVPQNKRDDFLPQNTKPTPLPPQTPTAHFIDVVNLPLSGIPLLVHIIIPKVPWSNFGVGAVQN